MSSDYSTPTLTNPENTWMPGDLPGDVPGDVPEQPAKAGEPIDQGSNTLGKETEAAVPEATATPAEAEAPSHTPAPPPAPNGQPYEADPAPAPEASSPPLEVPQLSLEALVEGLLFVADGAVTVARLAEALEVTPRAVEQALTVLAGSYTGRGLSLQRHRDKVQLTTHPAAAERVERFLGLAATTALSKAALETLAIIAYQQPVTRPQIEAVRGVNSDSVIKNLLSKGLVEEAGRTEGPGRPTLYTTTPEFLQHFGLTALTDLPPLSQDGPATLTPAEILKG